MQRRGLSLREIPALSVMEGREKKVPVGGAKIADTVLQGLGP